MATDLEQQAAVMDATMDDQERREREEAVKAMIEDEKHLIDYGMASREESRIAHRELREEWDKSWNAYELVRDNSGKEDWQSSVITPLPFSTVQQAKQIIRKSLLDRPDYFSVTGVEKRDRPMAEFHKASLDFHLSPSQANFPMAFSDAAEMSFAVGQSMEIIPQWKKRTNGTEGLFIALAPPWHINRDPSATSRDPQSGMYWIHDEYMDKWELLELESEGIYQNIEKAFSGGDGGDEKERDERRRKMVVARHKYRQSMKIHEFWGVILDKQGRILHPNSTFTWAGTTIIRALRPNRHPSIRWPGVGFSPIPHLMRHTGRGVLWGVLSLWRLGDNLLNLHFDDLNWVINRMFEIDPKLLVDEGSDSEAYPGKHWFRKAGMAGATAIREVAMTRSHTSDVLPNLQYIFQLWQNGTFVNEFVTGIPGSRSNITKGEVQIKTQQSLGMFDSFGKELEFGAIWAIRAIMDVLAINWTELSIPGMDEVMGGRLGPLIEAIRLADPEQRMHHLRTNADIKVNGISALITRSENLQRIDALMQRAESPNWQPYIKMFNLLSSAVDMMGLSDEDVLKTPQELQDEQDQIQKANAGGDLRDVLVGGALNKAGINKTKQPNPANPSSPSPVT